MIAQLETRAALENLEAIAAVDGIDALFIGPSDLSADLGFLGQSSHPEVVAVVDRAIQRIRQTGKMAGILAPSEEYAHHCLGQGCLLVGVGSDLGILARHSEALAGRFRRG